MKRMLGHSILFVIGALIGGALIWFIQGNRYAEWQYLYTKSTIEQLQGLNGAQCGTTRTLLENQLDNHIISSEVLLHSPFSSHRGYARESLKLAANYRSKTEYTPSSPGIQRLITSALASVK